MLLFKAKIRDILRLKEYKICMKIILNFAMFLLITSTAFAFTKETPLMTAAFKNNAAEVDRLLASGVPVDEVDEHQQTALFYAIAGASVKATQSLLKARANPNHLNDERVSPLDVAEENLDLGVFESLLNYGANINYRYSSNAAHIVMRLTRFTHFNDWTQFFLRKDVNFTAPTTSIYGSIEMPLAHQLVSMSALTPVNFEKMLSLGVDPKLTDYSQNTFLHQIAPSLLYRTGDEAGQCSEGCTQYIAIMNNLLSLGLDVNGKNNKGETPLLLLMRNDYAFNSSTLVGLANKWISQGADPYVITSDGKSIFSEIRLNSIKTIDMGFIKSIFETHKYEKEMVAHGKGALFRALILEGTREQFDYILSFAKKLDNNEDYDNAIDILTSSPIPEHDDWSYDEYAYRVSKVLSLGADPKKAIHSLKNVIYDDKPEVFFYLLNQGVSLKDSYGMEDSLWYLCYKFINSDPNLSVYKNVVKRIRGAGYLSQDACDKMANTKYANLFCR
jgi:hypothetical protein